MNLNKRCKRRHAHLVILRQPVLIIDSLGSYTEVHHVFKHRHDARNGLFNYDLVKKKEARQMKKKTVTTGCSALDTLLSGGLRRGDMWMMGALTTSSRFPLASDVRHG